MNVLPFLKVGASGIGVAFSKTFAFLAANVFNRKLIIGVYIAILFVTFFSAYQVDNNIKDGIMEVGAISLGVDQTLEEKAKAFVENKEEMINYDEFQPNLKPIPEKNIFSKTYISVQNWFIQTWSVIKFKFMAAYTFISLIWIINLYLLLFGAIYTIWGFLNDTSRPYVNVILAISTFIILHMLYFYISGGEFRFFEGLRYVIANYAVIWQSFADMFSNGFIDNIKYTGGNITNGSAN